MPNYYTRQEGDLVPGRLAKAEDINAIQDAIEAALAQTISDNFGDAYVLDPQEDVFELLPINTYYDQTNENATGWQSLYDYYVRQTINPHKSSITSIIIRIKNDSQTSKTLRTELRTVEEDMDDTELIASYDVIIPGSTSGTEYELVFGADHLVANEYYFIIKRVDIDGISVQYDESGTNYNASMALSPTGELYTTIGSGADLWFKTKYGGDQTYDVTGGVAVVHGEKIHNKDTHITIPPRSGYGNRIDIVVMDEQGEFSVIQGEASTTTPVAPDEAVPYGYLKIAYVTVPRDTSSLLIVDQIDTYGKSRLRSHQERLRRLEKKSSWMFEYNAPERIKYNLTGSSFVGTLVNMEAITTGSKITGYRLASNEIIDKFWSFKNFNGTPPIEGEYENDSGIASFTDLDHDDHVNGTIFLAQKTVEEVAYATWVPKNQRYPPCNSGNVSLNREYHIWNNGKYYSEYPAGAFNLSHSIELSSIHIDCRFYINVAGVRLVLFQVGSTGRDYHYKGQSAYYNLSNRSPGKYGIVNTEVLFLGFSGVSLSPGRYVFLVVPYPKNKHNVCRMWTNNFNYPGRSSNAESFIGWFPPTIPSWDSGNKRYGITLQHKYAETFAFDIISTRKVLVSNGYMQSSTIHTNYGIASVMVDMNLNLPANTTYTLEVSNDGGTSFLPMTSDILNFTSTGGQDFVWKLTLRSTDGKATPVLSYDDFKQYAIKFTLGLTGGNPPLTGSLLTAAFDGPAISKTALQSTVDHFSHWEWLRVWAKENAGALTIDIEANDTATTGPWVTIKSDLTLDELYHGSVDYSDYEGSFEEDEYNYHCDLDEEIILEDRVIIASCDTVWNDISPPSGITYVSDTGVFVEGTASFQLKFSNYSTVSELMAIKLVDLDLSEYDSVSLYIRPYTSIAAGALQFCIGTNAACTTGEFHDIPALTSSVWNTVTIKLDDPAALNNIQSLGIKKNAAVTWNDTNDGIRIDSVEGLVSNTKTIENCDTVWTKGQNPITASVDTSTKQEGMGSAKFVASTGVSTSSPLGYKATTLDLSSYRQIRFWVKTSVNLAAGDFKIAFCSDATGTTPIGEMYPVPAISTTNWVQVTTDLENPELLTNVQSISIKIGVAHDSQTFYFDKFEAIKTVDYPFYQKFIRLKFNLSRTNGADLSPTIRKVGVIPILK